MAKAWLGTFIILILLIIAYSIDLFAFLADKAVYYIAVVLLILALSAAGIILGNPFKKDREDDKSDE